MSIAQSFIIRIRLEPTAGEPGGATWRGSIIHAPSGNKRYFDKLSAIARFIAPYLTELGVVLEEDDRRHIEAGQDETKEG